MAFLDCATPRSRANSKPDENSALQNMMTNMRDLKAGFEAMNKNVGCLLERNAIAEQALSRLEHQNKTLMNLLLVNKPDEEKAKPPQAQQSPAAMDQISSTLQQVSRALEKYNGCSIDEVGACMRTHTKEVIAAISEFSCENTDNGVLAVQVPLKDKKKLQPVAVKGVESGQGIETEALVDSVRDGVNGNIVPTPPRNPTVIDPDDHVRHSRSSYFDHQQKSSIVGQSGSCKGGSGEELAEQAGTEPNTKSKKRTKRKKKHGKMLDARLSLEKTVYHMEEHYKDASIFAKIARDPRLEHLTAFMTVLNCVFIGIEADTNKAHYLYAADWIHIAQAQVFAVYFMLDLIVRCLALDRPLNSFKDSWFKLDFFLVVTTILDVWVVQPIVALVNDETHGKITIPTQPMRILRLLKLMRFARLMQAFPELLTLLTGFGRSLRAIASTFGLIFILMYVWGVLLRMLMGTKTKFNEYLKTNYDYHFATLIECIWCLLIDGVLQLDNAGLIMTDMIWHKDYLGHHDPAIMLSGILFTSFSVLSAIMILQMLIGVMCDVVARVGEEQRESGHAKLVTDQLLGELQAISPGDDKVSKSEFAAFMESEALEGILPELRINPGFFADLASLFFIDADAQIPMAFLLELLLLCRGDNVVTTELISFVLNFLSNEFVDMENRIVSEIKLIVGTGTNVKSSLDHESVVLETTNQ